MAISVDDRKDELLEAFQLFDIDKNGTISVDELGTLLKKLNRPHDVQQIKTMMGTCDDNGDGQIDFEEFCQLMGRPTSKDFTFETELREAFKVFDKDDDGYIDASELMSVLTSIGEATTEEEITTMIAEADLNGDGKMDWDEFVKVMTY